MKNSKLIQLTIALLTTIYCCVSTPSHAQKISIDRTTLIAITKKAETGQICCAESENLRIETITLHDSLFNYRKEQAILKSDIKNLQSDLKYWRYVAIALGLLVAIKVAMFVRKLLPL